MKTLLLLSVAAAMVVVPLASFPQTATASIEPVPCSDPRGCPDLIADASTMEPKLQTKTFKANDCNVVEGSTQAGTRKVLRFTFSTPNVGSGDLLVGDPSQHPEWFEWGACHGHYHFKLYAEYRLWTPAQFQRWDALRVANPDKTADQVLAENPTLSYTVGKKQGFCVIDIYAYDVVAAPKYLTCLYQGISTGWADEYASGLDGQFVDVTNVASGTYVLEEEVNAHRLYVEEDYNNNRAWVTVTI